MSFAAAAARFSRLGSRHDVALNPATVCQVLANVVQTTQFAVSLSPVRRTQDTTENGVLVLWRAQLRVPKALLWQPAEGDEFSVVATGHRFRCLNAIGADNAAQAAIVCDVVRISP